MILEPYRSRISRRIDTISAASKPASTPLTSSGESFDFTGWTAKIEPSLRLINTLPSVLAFSSSEAFPYADLFLRGKR
jgi:hypothetical protein